ncbi:hypothetical protein CHELA20_40325 [Hyphomicrobiales bacterium]|nr:hypothetical protein CHELA20_40325 [Hyphomicrobiales bacterium]CAH1688200.1 hypothetical protein CHELA41_40183 [Hyphomicrobiales bacterium]
MQDCHDRATIFEKVVPRFPTRRAMGTSMRDDPKQAYRTAVREDIAQFIANAQKVGRESLSRSD